MTDEFAKLIRLIRFPVASKIKMYIFAIFIDKEDSMPRLRSLKPYLNKIYFRAYLMNVNIVLLNHVRLTNAKFSKLRSVRSVIYNNRSSEICCYKTIHSHK